MPTSRRRHERLLCSIPVVLKERQSATRLYTENISRGGAFVVTDGAKAERQLINLSFELPDGAIDVLATVAWRSPANGETVARLPGMGLNFFALAKPARDRWDRFVLGLEAETRKSTAEYPPIRQPRMRSMTPIRRRHPRYTSRFMVRLQDREQMREFFTKDISAGGIFLQTNHFEEEGQRVKAVLVHPETRAEFTLPGRVLRVEATRPTRGIAIAFEDLPASRQAALLSFIETGAEFLNTEEDQAARLVLLRQAVAIEPSSPLPLVALAQALLEDFETEAAVELLNGALARDPSCLSAHRELYKAFNMMKLPERARLHLDAIRRLEQSPRS